MSASVLASTIGSPMREAPRIGPNSVLQSLRALAELESAQVLAAIRDRAALPDPLPDGMIPDAWFVRLVEAIRAELPDDRAEAVLQRAGAHTATYVAAHRIPRPIRALLAVLPARLGIPILLTAFRKHAWTFAGAGRFAIEGEYPGTLVLEDAPTCREHGDGPLRGSYYAAAFEGLLRLASARVHVHEIACQGAGAARCRFHVSFDAARTEVPCASS